MKNFKKLFERYGIDGYIVPKNDEYFAEYVFQDRLKTITNFEGSAGLAIVLKKKNYLFVDGRYTIQAQQQSGKLFEIIDLQVLLLIRQDCMLLLREQLHRLLLEHMGSTKDEFA